MLNARSRMPSVTLLDAPEWTDALTFQANDSEARPSGTGLRAPVDPQLAMPSCQVLHTCPVCDSAGPKALVEKKRFSIPAICNPLNTILLRGYRETFYYPHCGRCGHTFAPC